MDTFQFNSDGPAVMVLIKRRRARPSDTDRAAPGESRGGPINCFRRGLGAIWFLWSQVQRVSVNVEKNR